MRGIIYTGGELFREAIRERPEAGDLTVAADSGLLAAEALGVRPHIIVGDFDSLGYVPQAPGAELIRVPAEKDETDTQLAVRIALERGADRLLIIGGFGGRADHTLANLYLLEKLAKEGVPARMVNGKTRARFLLSGTEEIERDPRFRYLSLFCAESEATGVCVEGCKYPLRDASLSRSNPTLAVSNEITEDTARVTVRSGGVWIIESGA